MIIWIENASEHRALDAIRRLSGGDLQRSLSIGEPSAAETKLTLEELKIRRIVGIYEHTDDTTQ